MGSLNNMYLCSLLEKAEYAIGDRVYINLTEGEEGIVCSYVLYDTHLEYCIRTAENDVLRVEGSSLTNEKVLF